MAQTAALAGWLTCFDLHAVPAYSLLPSCKSLTHCSAAYTPTHQVVFSLEMRA